jgi:hypothetical protein
VGLLFVSAVAFGSALRVIGLGATGDEAGPCVVVEVGGSIFTDGAGGLSAAAALGAMAGAGATITGAVGKG